jgi:hypothetical protein
VARPKKIDKNPRAVFRFSSWEENWQLTQRAKDEKNNSTVNKISLLSQEVPIFLNAYNDRKGLLRWKCAPTMAVTIVTKTTSVYGENT